MSRIPTRAELEASVDYLRHRDDIARALHGFDVSCCSQQVPAAASIRALAWNVERGKNFEGIATALEREPALRDADLLLLTEVDLGMARSENRHVAADLARMLDVDFVYCNHHLVLSPGDAGEQHVTEPNACGYHGSALLSRLPISRFAAVSLPEYTDKFECLDKRLGTKRALLAEVQTGLGPLSVAVVHLDPFSPPRHRAHQIGLVLDGLDSFGNPRVLLGGDLNTSTYDLSRGRNALRDAVLKLLRHRIRGTLEHYLEPWREFERELFERLDLAGLDWREFNELSAPTIFYDLYDPELVAKTRAYLPAMVWRAFERLLARTPHAALRLDWFAGRELAATGRGVVPLHGPADHADRISDHLPLWVELAVPG